MRWLGGLVLLAAIVAAVFLIERERKLDPTRAERDARVETSEETVSRATELAEPAVGSPDRPAPSRLALEATEITARVLDSDGQPVSGARLSWTPFEPQLVASRSSWAGADPSALAEATVLAESGPDGAFAFARAPASAATHGSVIWALHPEHEAKALVLDADAPPPSEPIVLQRASARRAQVVDGEGRPVPGAVVLQRAVAEEDAAEGPATWARRLLALEGRAGPDGTVALATFSGREALVARHDGRTSPPTVRTCTGDVVLVLAPSFAAEGLVRLERGTVEARATHVRAATRHASEEWTDLATADVTVDGTWGPMTLPLADAAAYRFTLEGGGVVRQDRELAPPLEGETLRVDFDAALGVDQYFVCIDAATGEILKDALLKVHWLEPDGTWTTIEARPDPGHGYILARGCRPGEIHYDARAPGYAFVRGFPGVVPEAEAATWEVELVPAGRVAGRVTFGGEPVTDFTIGHWPANDLTQVRKEVVAASEDGSFVLTDVAEGELDLVAHADGHGQSDVQRVAITAGEVTEVTLELHESARGRGQVVDQITRAPIAGALVQLFATSGSRAVQPTGSPAVTDADGRFELEGLSVVASTFSTRAEGYSATYTTARGEPGRTVDLGLVALAPTQPLELRLRYGPDQDPTRYSVGSTKRELPKTPFPPGGVLRVDSFPAGYHQFVVDLPDRSTFDRPVELLPGAEWVVELPVDGSARVRVEVVPEEGAELPPELWVFVKYPLERSSMDRIALLPPTGHVTLEHVLPGRCYVQIEEDKHLVASETVDLRPGADESLRFPLGPLYRFRAVDPDGAPLPGTTIAFLVDGEGGADIAGTTDAQGELRCGGFSDGEVRAHLKHPNLGITVDVPVDLPADPNDVVELEFAAEATWSAVLRDGDEALPGITCELFPRGLKMIVSQAKTTDGDGRVSWDGLGRGEYELVARHPDCWPVDVTLPTTEGAPHVVQMRRRGDLLVRVRRADGRRLAGVPIEVDSVESDAPVSAWIGAGLVTPLPTDSRTDDSGELHLEGLPHGDYRWRALVPGSTPLQGTTTVPPGSLASVDAVAP